MSIILPGWLEDNSKPSWNDTLPFTNHCPSVGLGSDFDGIGDAPVGLEDVSKYPALVSYYFHPCRYSLIWARLRSFTFAGGASTNLLV